MIDCNSSSEGMLATIFQEEPFQLERWKGAG